MPVIARDNHRARTDASGIVRGTLFAPQRVAKAYWRRRTRDVRFAGPARLG